MPRRGQFGRLPRVQPSLTGTLVSIAREMQAREDQNIMDAWKNGGLFQGKKATDDVTLAYWQNRMKNLSPDDPNYDTFRNQVMQLQYGIEQSKQDLLHVQGKISDAQYAQFFLKWSSKVPKDSEFWRTLQKDAAQLIESAKAKGRANADKARADQFNAFVKNRQGDTDLGNAITDAMQKISKETGLSITGNGDHLLQLLSDDFRAHPDEYRQLQDALKGTSFNGTFTHEFVANSIDQARSAYSQIATRADHDGYATAYSNASKAQGTMSDWGQNLSVWDTATTYTRLENDLAQVWNNPNASWSDKQRAAGKFSAGVNALASTPGIDMGSKTMLQADAKRALGEDAGDAPSFGTAMLGHTGFTPDMGTQVGFYKAAEDLKNSSPPGVYVYASTNKDGSFDAEGKGPIGIVQASGLPAGTVSVAVPGLDGTAKLVSVLPRDIKVTDPNNPGADAQTIGKFITYQAGQNTVTLYQYTDAHGQVQWSNSSPLADGTVTTYDKGGNLVVTPPSRTNPLDVAGQISPDLAKQMKAAMDANGGVLPPGSSFSSSSYTHDKGGNQKITYSFDGTQFKTTTTDQVMGPDGHITDGSSTTVVNPINQISNLYSSVMAGSRLSAGNLPGVTFSTPTEASMAAAATNLSGQQVASLAQDPLFQQQFIVQQMKTYQTSDPLDPRIVSNWDKLTTTAKNATMPPGSTVGTWAPTPSNYAATRPDLNLPGQQPQGARQDLSITFNGQAITIPNAPSYLSQATAALTDRYGNQLAAGGIPGGPDRTYDSIEKQRAMAGITPTVTPTSTAPPPKGITPTATPAPAPTVTVGPGPTPLKNPGTAPSGWTPTPNYYGPPPPPADLGSNRRGY